MSSGGGLEWTLKRMDERKKWKTDDEYDFKEKLGDVELRDAVKDTAVTNYNGATNNDSDDSSDGTDY